LPFLSKSIAVNSSLERSPLKLNGLNLIKKLPNLTVRKLQALIEHLDDLRAVAVAKHFPFK
jgi:hypothetical protein